MSDLHDQDQPPAPPESEVLARIPAGAADGGLSVNPPAPALSHQKSVPGDSGQLTRPRGALIAMRKSGGIRFTWRLLVVHRDGRIIYKSNEIGAPDAARVLARLDPAQLADLQAQVAQADFTPPAPGAARQNPDAFAYEVVARVGRKNVAVEVFEGSVPESLKPLIQQLNRLLPTPDRAS